MPLVVILCRPSDVPAPAGSRRRWEDFFLPGGQDPSNCVAYWTDLSYGQYDAGGSRVFDWIDIGHTRAEIDALSGQEQRRHLAAWGREAAVRAGIRLADFRQVVFGYNINADHGSVGGNSIVLAYAEGRPFEPTFMHHEFGHALGLGHSSSQNDGVYWDRFDIMSAMNVWTFQDTRVRAVGPGAAAPNLENLGWLDRSCMWQSWPLTPQTITLVALNRPAVAGYLAARLQYPQTSDQAYYLEYREVTAWDRGLPGPRVLVHTRTRKMARRLSAAGGTRPVPSKPGRSSSCQTAHTRSPCVSRLSISDRLGRPCGCRHCRMSWPGRRTGPLSAAWYSASRRWLATPPAAWRSSSAEPTIASTISGRLVSGRLVRGRANRRATYRT